MIILLLSNGCYQDNELINNNEELDEGHEISHESEPTEEPNSITMDDIKAKYDDSEKLKMNLINNKYVLAQYIGETGVMYYELYNLNNGSKDIIHNDGTYTQLDTIYSENYIVLLSSGKSTETNIGTFPYKIHCFRVRDDNNSVFDFMTVVENINYHLYESISSGSKRVSNLNESLITFDGLQLKYEPIEGKESFFFAAALDIPPTEIHLNEQEYLIYIDILVERFNEELIKNINTEKCEYIDSIEIREQEEGIRLAIAVSQNVKSYQVSKIRTDNSIIFDISFN